MFNLDPKQMGMITDWLKQHDVTCPYANPARQGASGGRLTYEFTPTTIGLIAKVKCGCGGSVDVSDYHNW